MEHIKFITALQYFRVYFTRVKEKSGSGERRRKERNRKSLEYINKNVTYGASRATEIYIS
jgi:hypothetical protein